MECTWWYHVKVAMENIPMEAWNDDGVKLILGDPCILDRLDSCTVDREMTDLLTCWVWMKDPMTFQGHWSTPFLLRKLARLMT
jgi:hypothetical protein